MHAPASGLLCIETESLANFECIQLKTAPTSEMEKEKVINRAPEMIRFAAAMGDVGVWVCALRARKAFGMWKILDNKHLN